jgi:hypothetical protein
MHFAIRMRLKIVAEGAFHRKPRAAILSMRDRLKYYYGQRHNDVWKGACCWYSHKVPVISIVIL